MDRGSKYHAYWGQNIMGRDFDISWIGGSIYHGKGIHNIIRRGLDIP